MHSRCCSSAKPKFKKVTHVIFDLDGTILDTEGIHYNAIKSIGEQYNKVMTDEMYNQMSGRLENDTCSMAVRLMSLPLTVEEFVMKFREITQQKIGDAAFLPGAERIIKHLHSNGIPMAVATSSNQPAVSIKIKNKKEIFDLFSHIVCGSDDPEVKRGKPFPDIFLICASRFPDNPQPSKCLVFEDAPNGVESALAAGMQVVMIPPDRIPYESWKNATLRLDSLDYMMLGAFGLPPYPTEEGSSNSPTEEGNDMSPAGEGKSNVPTDQQPELENNDETYVYI